MSNPTVHERRLHGFAQRLNRVQVSLETFKTALKMLGQEADLEHLKKLRRWYRAIRAEVRKLDQESAEIFDRQVSPQLLRPLYAMQSWARFRKLWDRTPDRIKSNRERVARYQSKPKVKKARAERERMRRLRKKFGAEREAA